MERSRLRLLPLLGAALLLMLPLLGAGAQDDAELQPRALDISAVEDTSHEKELIEALQEVLKKLKSKRIPIYEKKYGQVPMCDAGEQCAVRKGARIGKLCDCPRGTSCNSFLLKCL
ncbi:Cocaine- and amphetamine-regulated transcript protein [Heterocephalus glaber]|uniref:Cocaine- and amphetamine-regulated transcript protein n=1 Tax=Heterocephalus glaber TaxID=10181 RepID=G5C0H4_HETGA|nr:cocaine- and amphetamine-regulated transcript protein [Heterocephalus glaber]EHB15035.1 Cocaine- and amphetamine-regulated transcript protein [Heterocephalus glaber]